MDRRASLRLISGPCLLIGSALVTRETLAGHGHLRFARSHVHADYADHWHGDEAQSSHYHNKHNGVSDRFHARREGGKVDTITVQPFYECLDHEDKRESSDQARLLCVVTV